jgi:hypothetical protein
MESIEWEEVFPVLCLAGVSCFSSEPAEVPVPVYCAVHKGSGETLGRKESTPLARPRIHGATLQSREDECDPWIPVVLPTYLETSPLV